MFNTGYQMLQSFLSFLLLAEFPTYMRLLKPVRAFSVGIAGIWNFFYIWVFLELFHDVYKAEYGGTHRPERYDLSTMLLDMMYSFNAAMHLPIWMINNVIIVRELKIELDKSEKYRTFMLGEKGPYNYRLGWSNVLNALIAVANFFNPFWWLYKIFFVRYEEEDANLKNYEN